jgi:hypothetical protein
VPAQNRANIEKFAQDFPIQSLEFQRESILLHQTDLVPAQSANLAELAADVQQDLGILQLTLNAHAAYLPRIARWQAELLLYDLDQTPTIATSVGVLKQVAEIVQDVVGKQLPALVDRERTSVLAAIHQERVETLESVEKMRQATIDSIVAQRLAIIEMLVSERAAVLKQVDTERTETMREARAIAKDTVVSALPTGNALIDHFYWRLVEFAVPLLLMCGVGLLIIRNTVAKAVAGKARTDRG